VQCGGRPDKDFVGGFIALWFFLTRHPCRVVTTSAKDDHLRVLWGEINNFIQTSRFPLTADKGGPLEVLHQDVRKVVEINGEKQRCALSYLVGMVAGPDSMAAMQGHHVAHQPDGVPRTLFISDESSSVRDEYYTMARTWANRTLVIGNPWPCQNFFYRGVTEGDLRAPERPGREEERYYRRVIRIGAVDSPNVRYALAQREAGVEPTGEVLLPGVKGWDEYLRNLATWDELQQCVSLEGRFYEGAEVMLYPAPWLYAAAEVLRVLACRARPAEAMGIDPAEGGDNTAWAVTNKWGLKELVSERTPDTNRIVDHTITLLLRHNLKSENVFMDRGGGGTQIAASLRARGYPVNTVGFGEAISEDPHHGRSPTSRRKLVREERYAYRNRRAQMYGILRELLTPNRDSTLYPDEGFALPGEYSELRRQLSLMPYLRDPEGRMEMLPKRAPASSDRKLKKPSLESLLGCSPDEADALVLAVYGMYAAPRRARVSAG